MVDGLRWQKIMKSEEYGIFFFIFIDHPRIWCKAD